MKYIIEYYWILSDHILATPEFHHKEEVEADSYEYLINYVTGQKDNYGNYYKFEPTKFLGFDFISKRGGVKIKRYKESVFKKI